MRKDATCTPLLRLRKQPDYLLQNGPDPRRLGGLADVEDGSDVAPLGGNGARHRVDAVEQIRSISPHLRRSSLFRFHRQQVGLGEASRRPRPFHPRHKFARGQSVAPPRPHHETRARLHFFDCSESADSHGSTIDYSKSIVNLGGFFFSRPVLSRPGEQYCAV